MFTLSWHKSDGTSQPQIYYRELKSSQVLTLGRGGGADIVIDDKTVSRFHAEFSIRNAHVRVRDTNSSNGVRIDGKQINKAIWVPGQKLRIGPFIFELSETFQSDSLEVVTPSRNITFSHQQNEAPDASGRIKVRELFHRARSNDTYAVTQLFSGFLGKTEEVIDCGYLGALGFIFPDHSFWCVTNSRVCGLRVNYAGWMNFDFGYIKYLNRAVFIQPSMIVIWIYVITWLLWWGSVALFFAYVTGLSVYIKTGYVLFGWITGILIFSIIFGIMVRAVPWVVRMYYRIVKAGCIFWTIELQPIVIPSDRHSLQHAQRFISVYSDQKRCLEL